MVTTAPLRKRPARGGADAILPVLYAPERQRRTKRDEDADHALGLRSMGFGVFVISGNPVLGDGFLRGRNIKLATANDVADDPFQPILGLSISISARCYGVVAARDLRSRRSHRDTAG